MGLRVSSLVVEAVLLVEAESELSGHEVTKGHNYLRAHEQRDHKERQRVLAT